VSSAVSDSRGTRTLGRIHGRAVHQRRVKVLARRLAPMVPPGSRLLEIGCGDGRIAALLRDWVPQLEVEGVEVLPRADCAITCRAFDGTHLPFPDDSFDGCLLVDVVHHVSDPLPLLKDACRVSSQFVLIKDHFAESALDRWTLRFMDWVSNAPHGVALPYAYLTRSQWEELYRPLGLSVDSSDRDLPLYPVPFASIFGRNLHFISRLKKTVHP
jgi:SAM-dependent methyltransferase